MTLNDIFSNGIELRQRGVDVYTIQKLMGHRDIKMTSKMYVHNEVDELKKRVFQWFQNKSKKDVKTETFKKWPILK